MCPRPNFHVWLELNSFSQNGGSYNKHKFNTRTFNMNTFDVLWVLHTTLHEEKQRTAQRKVSSRVLTH